MKTALLKRLKRLEEVCSVGDGPPVELHIGISRNYQPNTPENAKL
jgi:hypothetical protein